MILDCDASSQCQVGVNTSVNTGRRSQKEIPLDMLVLYGDGVLYSNRMGLLNPMGMVLSTTLIHWAPQISDPLAPIQLKGTNLTRGDYSIVVQQRLLANTRQLLLNDVIGTKILCYSKDATLCW